ncbi:MAG: MotA/TolQ/ExbB proton channel family protein [Anaeromyxobacter sp.]|nr:MotA/TolQ/ExbB proton channel family protein [Anaeromyxobacter sp.]
MLTQKFLQLFEVGAEWVSWVLVAVSLFGTAVVIDRLRLLLRTRERFDDLRAALSAALARGDAAAALAAVAGDSLIRNVLRAGLALAVRGERRTEPVEQAMLGALAGERARYDARLSTLLTIGNTGPLIGLLGTVIGIVQAFNQLGRMGTVQAANNAAVMSAIGEALVTTGLGIAVSVPAVVIYNAVRAHLTERVKQAEALQRQVIAALPGLGGAGAGG